MLHVAGLYAIVDVAVCGLFQRQPREVGRAFLGGGARFLQLRAKDLASGPMLDLAAAMAQDAAGADARLIVNDRADVALLSGAHGVHVGQDDLSVDDVRRILGPDALVGLSTHTITQFEAGLAGSASYLAVGPVFDTATKNTGYEAVGLDLVRRCAALVAGRVPVVAIGGITLERAPSVIAAGADSVAVITDLLVGDVEARVRQWVDVLGKQPG